MPMDVAALRRWWPPAAVALLVAATAAAAAFSRPGLDRTAPRVNVAPSLRPPELEAVATPQEATAGPDKLVQAGLPGWVGTALLGVLAAVLVAVVVLVVWTVLRDQLRRRPRREPIADRPEAPAPTDDVVAALDAGLEDLSDNDRDPRRAVIACWVRLEQAAAVAGTPRQPGDTPADLVGRLLREQQVSPAVLAGLAEVYREARYATHVVDDRMRAQARAALQRLRSDLTSGVDA